MFLVLVALFTILDCTFIIFVVIRVSTINLEFFQSSHIQMVKITTEIFFSFDLVSAQSNTASTKHIPVCWVLAIVFQLSQS